MNAQRRYQGSTDLPLSPAGRAMLRRADVTPERVFVSPLVRAVETAAILFPSSRLVTVEGLQEMNFGVFEGRSADEMGTDCRYRAWVDGGCEGRCPGGESRGEFCDRVCETFVRLLERERQWGSGLLVIVAHAGTQMSVLERFGVPKRPYYRWMTGNGCGFVLSDEDWERNQTLKLLGERRFTGGVSW